MPDPTRARRGAALGAVLALWGVWISHTLEHLRVCGMGRLAAELATPAHAYMLPAVAVLAGLGALAGVFLASGLARLGQRVDRVQRALRAAWRGRSPKSGRIAPAPARPTFATETVLLVAALFIVQLLLYLVQENLETALTGVAGPWWAPITGIHWAAPLLHLGVACALVLATTPLRRRARLLAEVVRTCERLLAVLARRLGRLAIQPPRSRRSPAPPLEVFGAQLWSRPPPHLRPC